MGREPMGVLLVCPYCGKRNDQHSRVMTKAEAAEEATPGPKDVPKQVAMCVACGGFAVADRAFVGFTLRMPTPAEIADIDEDPKFEQLRQAWAKSFGKTPAPWPS